MNLEFRIKINLGDLLICLFAYLLITPMALAQATLSTPTPIHFQSNFSLSPTPLATPLPINRNVNVSATVGDYTLTVSGTIAPFASVTLIAGDTPLKAVVSDASGYFILQVRVARGFFQFCLDGIDIKRYGESYSCFNISPVLANFTDANLYLPPTVGLDRKELVAGESIIVRGYGMPYSYTLIHLSDGRILYIHTDSTGFYEVKIPINKVGSYSLFANATYKGKISAPPQNKLNFSAISQWENLLRLIVKLLTPPLLYIWIILLIFILVFIRFFSKKYSQLRHAMRIGWGAKSKAKLLHHAWFVGY